MEGGWVWGHHPDITAAQQPGLEATVGANQAALACSLAELPGYCASGPPFTGPPVHNKPIFSPPRLHSPLEQEIKNKKCGELWGVAFTKPAPPGTQYASSATMPAKKDPATGLCTDVRMCKGLRAIHEATVRDRCGIHLPEHLFRPVAVACSGCGMQWLAAGPSAISICTRATCKSRWLRPQEDQPKTSFWWHNNLWCYTRLPFSMVSGPLFEKIPACA